MALKKILVHLDNTPQCKVRLDLAIRFAQKHQAHLSGFYIGVSSGSFFGRNNDSENGSEEIKTLFDQLTSEAGITTHWRQTTTTAQKVAETLSYQSYFSDLLIVSQTDYGTENRTLPDDLPERLVLGAGRPILVVPYAGTFDSAGERVMLAWRGDRESPRAIKDAIPILQKARSVKILSINNPGDNGDEPLDRVRSYLGCHDIKARTEEISIGEIDTGDMLLNQVSDEGPDLLVMGIYAYTRRGALVPGPVGSYILKHMTVPVLVSH